VTFGEMVRYGTLELAFRTRPAHVNGGKIAEK